MGHALATGPACLFERQAQLPMDRVRAPVTASVSIRSGRAAWRLRATRRSADARNLGGDEHYQMARRGLPTGRPGGRPGRALGGLFGLAGTLAMADAIR
jgi:hypothetical protein